MTVIYSNELYRLENMPYRLFQHLKKNKPAYKVSLYPLDEKATESILADIKDVEDWSIHRNTTALNS